MPRLNIPYNLKKIGSEQNTAKLTEADIPIIRERAKTETPETIALDYPVGPKAIKDIIKRRSWHHVK